MLGEDVRNVAQEEVSPFCFGLYTKILFFPYWTAMICKKREKGGHTSFTEREVLTNIH